MCPNSVCLGALPLLACGQFTPGYFQSEERRAPASSSNSKYPGARGRASHPRCVTSARSGDEIQMRAGYFGFDRDLCRDENRRHQETASPRGSSAEITLSTREDTPGHLRPLGRRRPLFRHATSRWTRKTDTNWSLALWTERATGPDLRLPPDARGQPGAKTCPVRVPSLFSGV